MPRGLTKDRDQNLLKVKAGQNLVKGLGSVCVCVDTPKGFNCQGMNVAKHAEWCRTVVTPQVTPVRVPAPHCICMKPDERMQTDRAQSSQGQVPTSGVGPTLHLKDLF